MVYLVTGGAGFLGSAIVEELISDEHADNVSDVRVLDLRKPNSVWAEQLTFFQGDIRDKPMVHMACRGVDIVIHPAAIVDWGTHCPEEVIDINAGGTEILIEACLEQNVPYFIYTSSLDAIFTGKSMVDIDESIPYPDNAVNAYCESKQQAEILVRQANGKHLKTCILRPADIYGECDPYHIGSLIDMAKKGFYVRLGNGKSKCQHTYVRNIAHAHVLVAKAFINENPSVEGNTYFITDGPGKNFFSFYDQVVTGAGYTIWPKNLWIPRWLAYVVASLCEFFAWLIRPVKKINPKFSRFAVIYTCSDFTFSAEKARRDFNYVPKYSEAEAIERTIKYYNQLRTTNKVRT